MNKSDSLTNKTSHTALGIRYVPRITALLVALLLVLNSAQAQSADFVFMPATTTVNVGDEFDLDIIVDTDGAPIDAAEIHLNFNTALLEVIALTPDDDELNVPLVPPEFDNGAGTIDYGAGTFFNFPTEDFRLITIRLKALAPTAGTDLVFNTTVFPVSDITSGGQSVLDEAFDGTVIINGTGGDNEPPMFMNCPGNIVVDNDPGQCNADVSWTEPTVTDNVGVTSSSQTHNPGDNFPVGVTTVTYTAMDAAGNTANCTFTVTVEDTEAPVISNCPGNISVAADAGTCSTTVDWTPPTATDNCPNLQFTSSHDPNTSFDVGTTTVTYTATDAAGTEVTCSFDVTVTDGENPVINNCPGAITVSAETDLCSAEVSWDAPTVSDNCPGATISSPFTPGASFPVGTTTVTYTATDASGNAVTCTFDVTVTDDQAPTLVCPADVTVTATNGETTASANWTVPTPMDNCPGASITSSSHNPGDDFPLGMTTVTYTATDAAGLTGTCTFTVTVSQDDELVIENCPMDINTDNDPDQCGAVVSWTPPTTSGGSGTVTLTTTHEPGTFFDIGTTTVTYTATDDNGSETCSFDVTVTDEQDPTLTACPGDINVEPATGACEAMVSWTPPTADDNCPGVTLNSTHQPNDVFPAGTTTVTYTATDAAGNMASCSFDVTVEDNDGPTITSCVDDIQVFNSPGECGALITWDPPVSGDCSAVTVTYSPQGPNTFFDIGKTTVTITFTDASGNTSMCDFNVDVRDNEMPSIGNCPTNILVSTDPGTCEATVFWPDITVTDNCPGSTLVGSHASGDIFPLGVTNVVFTATDGFFNETTCEFTVTVVDDVDPMIMGCPGDITVAVEQGSSSATVSWTEPTATDNCPGVTISGDATPGDQFDLGSTTVTYTATDAVGNTATCTFTVTVTDDEAPIIANCPGDITVSNDPGVCEAAVTWDAPTASDNGTVTSFTSTHDPGDVFPVGTTTVTYTATDDNNNSTTCSFDVTVNDTENPTFDACPGNIIVDNDAGACGANVTWNVPTFADNCGIESQSATHDSGDFFDVGTTTVTYTATDAAGNTATCTFDVTVNDTEDPTITGCPGDITVAADAGSDMTAVSWTPPTASDNCPGHLLVSTHVPGDEFPIGTTTVTYTVTDSDDNTDVCSFTVTVTDDESPTFANCPANISMDNDPGECSAVVSWTEPTATDNGTVVSVTSTHEPGDEFPVGMTTVTYTATDDNGNTGTCSFTVTVVDSEAPSINNCPADIDAEIGMAGETATVSWTLPTVSDNCPNPTLAASHQPGDEFPEGTTQVTYTATDAAGLTTTCTFDVTVTLVVDPPPTFENCPDDITVDTDAGVCEAAVSWTEPTATDNGTITSETSTHDPGDIFPVGTTTVTYTAMDDAGNTATCTFDVTVVDNEDPAYQNCPGDITVSAPLGGDNAVVDWDEPTATDNCPGVSSSSSHDPGDTFPVGTTTVTYTATDAAGNTGTCSFDVTVTTNQAPIIADCPGDITENNDPGVCEAAVSWTEPTVTDDGTVVSFVSSHDPGDVFPVGTTTVTYTATDDDNNVSTCSFEVTVVDNEAPTINDCPADIDVTIGVGGVMVDVSWTPPTVSDNCPNPTLAASQAPGSQFPIGTTTVTYTATDAAGSVATCSFDVTVTVVIDAPPTFENCPNDITVNNDAGACEAAVSWTEPTATDDGTVVSVTSTHDPGDVFPVGTTTVTYTATDNAGNTGTCTFDVTVVDNELPVYTDCPTDITVDTEDGMCAAQVFWLVPGLSDNCPGVSGSASHESGDMFQLGTTTVTYTATDAAGNQAVCSFTVTVGDNAPPMIVCPDDITVSNDPNTCGAVVTFDDPSTLDACGLSGVSADIPSGSFFQIGATIVTFTATDLAGNSTTCTFTVTVNDTEAPVLTCPADITVDGNTTDCGAIVTWEPPTLGDNCVGASVTSSSHSSGDFFPIGATVVTYNAIDAAGNTVSCSFTVTVNDSGVLGITCPDDVTVGSDLDECGANVTWTEPGVSGGCVNGNTITSDFSPGDFFPVGTTTVTYTVTEDGTGNTATCSFTVTVEDDQPATFDCPAEILVGTDDGTCGAIVTYDAPIATDNCDTYTSTFESGLESGAFFPIGTTVVTYSASNGAGSTLTCSFEVTVEDTENPSIDCADDFTVENTAGTCEAEVDLPVPAAADNCGVASVDGRFRAVDEDGNPLGPWSAFTPGPQSGTFAVGRYQVNWRATDDAGNVGGCNMFFEVLDTDLPTVTCVEDYEVALVNSEPTTVDPNELVDEATDNCGIAEVTLSQSTFDCDDLGEHNLVLVVTDAAGNTATCELVVTVVEAEGLPGPWDNMDIGEPAEDGSVEYGPCDEQFAVTSGSFGDLLVPDEGHFVYQEICDDAEIITQVSSLDGLGRAGIMMRESLDDDAKFVSLTSQLSTYVYRNFRTSTGGSATTNPLLRPNVSWLRIVRTNNNFVGYTSLNGTSWQFAFSLIIQMDDCIFVGLFVETHNEETTAVFNNTTLIGDPLIPFAEDGTQEETQIAQRTPTPEMGIFPNPVSTDLNLDLDGWGEERIIVEIRRIGGQRVHAEIIEGRTTRTVINLEQYNLEPGVYFLTAHSAAGVVTRRFYKAE